METIDLNLLGQLARSLQSDMGFGQYSDRGTGRRTKDDLVRFAPYGYSDAQLWGHNRLKVTYPDRIEYRLHDTAVVTVRKNGEIVVDDGGYPTVTTSAAIRQALTAATGLPSTFYRDRKSVCVAHVNGREFKGTLPLIVS